MKFDNPNFFILLWIVPILVFFYIKAFSKKKKLTNLFAQKEVLQKFLNLKSVKKYFYYKVIFSITAILFIIIALTQPQFGYKLEDSVRKGQDIVVAVDVSKSMLAGDIKPNRLERARRKLKDFLQILEGDRVALVYFSGTGFIQCPLKLDNESFCIILDYLEPSMIPVPGTSVANALETSIKAFSDKSSRGKSIILITDGEDQEKGLDKVLSTLKEKGIRVFSIGIGKEDGSPITLDTGEILRDESGKPVISKLDVKTLSNISSETGGKYVQSVSGDLDIKGIYFDGIKSSGEEQEFKSSKKKVWEERFQIFVLLAFLLLSLEFIFNELSKKEITLTNEN
ncbi:MAG: VWA domain-containing protein [Candidatus Sericytochromatia bacterium]